MKFPKTKPMRSESYRRYVANFPCFGCGIIGFSQAAHPNGGGMGTKTSDLDCFPLCCTRPGHMGCHQMFDLCLDMTKHQRRKLTAQYSARMRFIARADGRCEFADAA